MSLIQEALKRKTEEEHRLPEQPEVPQPAPPAEKPPEPLPPQVPVSPKPPSNNTPALIAVIILLLFIICGGTYILLQHKKTAAAQSSPEPKPIQVSEAPVTPDLPPVLEAAPEPAPKPSPEPEPEPPPEEAPEPAVKWPDLNYSGAAASGNQVLAIINGRMLSIGDKIQEVKVLQIGKTEVLVEFKGEKRILRLDNQ